MTARLLSTCLVLVLAGCGPQGYASAERLEESHLGPAGCAERCGELGMEMAALVLVGTVHSGCVCQPIRTSGGASDAEVSVLSAAAAGDAALEVVLAEQRAAAVAASRRR